MTKEEIVDVIEKAQIAYRDGNPILSDSEYDIFVEELKSIDPEHPIINTVEPESFNRPTVKHPKPMLSTEKVFTKEDLQKWFKRIEKKYGKQEYRITPKLDGMSARIGENVLVTRGDGEVGYDITDAWYRGLVNSHEDYNSNLGEIVMVKSYYKQKLKDVFDHPRNCIVGAIKCDTLSDIQKQTFQDSAIHFVPYDRLPRIVAPSDRMIEYLDNFIESLSCIDYPIDGFVIEIVDNDELKEQMGHTSHHYRWQVAYKTVTETVSTIVNNIIWQTGRGGNITPVLEVEPVKVSGAVIKRVTGHNYGYLKEKGIGIGTEISIVRSGEVIPKVVNVLNESFKEVKYVYNCPVCDNETVLVNDIINCPNFNCSAQVIGRLRHFFKSLKIDGFGESTIKLLVDNGFLSLEKILKMNENQLVSIGFGEKQSSNLVNSISISINGVEYDDWKILSSVSIPMLGKGDSKKLLKKYHINDLFNLVESDITQIDGFAEKKAKSIVKGLEENKELINFLINTFKIKHTMESEVKNGGLKGKKFVFTGKMNEPRGILFEYCEENGGEPQKSITKTTDYLVTGEKVGKSKLDKAQKYGIMTISEYEFMEMIGK